MARNYNSAANYNDGTCSYDEPQDIIILPAPTPSLPTVPPATPQVPDHQIVQKDGSNNTPSSPPLASQSSQVSQTCSPYLTTFIKLGGNNNSDDVKRLQIFLNNHEGEALSVDGRYKILDYEAVKRFQVKYSDILRYWNLDHPTGYVYTATQNTVNALYCQSQPVIQVPKTAAICPYFTIYQKEGDSSPEVIKIKEFLNNLQNAGLAASPLYDASLTQAVKKFQSIHASAALTPWGLKAPTGWWYQSTRKTANDLVGCGETIRLDNGKVLK